MIEIKLHPRYAKWKPRTIERNRKFAVEYFKKKGNSQHSGMGMMLPFVLNYCEENCIPYVLKAYPGQGYYIEKAPPL